MRQIWTAEAAEPSSINQLNEEITQAHSLFKNMQLFNIKKKKKRTCNYVLEWLFLK